MVHQSRATKFTTGLKTNSNEEVLWVGIQRYMAWDDIGSCRDQGMPFLLVLCGYQDFGKMAPLVPVGSGSSSWCPAWAQPTCSISSTHLLAHSLFQTRLAPSPQDPTLSWQLDRTCAHPPPNIRVLVMAIPSMEVYPKEFNTHIYSKTYMMRDGRRANWIKAVKNTKFQLILGM